MKLAILLIAITLLVSVHAFRAQAKNKVAMQMGSTLMSKLDLAVRRNSTEMLRDYIHGYTERSNEDNLGYSFKIADNDEDGTVSAGDMAWFLDELNINLTKDYLQFFLPYFDEDKDGELNWEEYYKMSIAFQGAAGSK